MFLRWMRLAGCGGSFKQVRDKPKPERDERARSSNAPLALGPFSGTAARSHMCAYLYHSLVVIMCNDMNMDKCYLIYASLVLISISRIHSP
jgi:hypothetical protein